ncbi:DUF6221 family protein [Streptomyces sp. NBC_01383]|uniref:DUF6221 family protein n=1 Tax=Streptomyces sp. NBC_01383 TaxID=2903846 RepID=UPI003247A75B
MTATLVTFLHARLNEDELRARSGYYSNTHWERFTTEAHLHAWQAWREHLPREQWDVRLNDLISEAARDAIRNRITAHEADRAARVLREVEAKRRLLDLHATVSRDIGWLESDGEGTAELPVCGHCVPRNSHYPRRKDVPECPCPTLRLLALPYTDHPDYRPGWRP